MFAGNISWKAVHWIDSSNRGNIYDNSTISTCRFAHVINSLVRRVDYSDLALIFFIKNLFLWRQNLSYQINCYHFLRFAFIENACITNDHINVAKCILGDSEGILNFFPDGNISLQENYFLRGVFGLQAMDYVVFIVDVKNSNILYKNDKCFYYGYI